MPDTLRTAVASIAISSALVVASAGLAQADEIALTIKDHRISPAEIHVPAKQDVTLRVTNADPTPEEFESDDLDVEKVIAGGESAVIRLSPLDPGRYEFYGEYHEDTAKGALVAE
jgi:hypothetical protein